MVVLVVEGAVVAVVVVVDSKLDVIGIRHCDFFHLLHFYHSRIGVFFCFFCFLFYLSYGWMIDYALNGWVQFDTGIVGLVWWNKLDQAWLRGKLGEKKRR